MSTIVNRTMQSGYSEYMGMFPPRKDSGIRLTDAQTDALRTGGISAPPFGVRSSNNLQEELGDLPLPQGFIQMPIFNHNEVSMGDDLDLTGCDYVNAVDGYRFPAESTY